MTDEHDGTAADGELAQLASVNLNLLVPLLALLEERSVTRAAARVGLSQPAMSHALRRMRRLLGDELIVRQGNGMALTPRAVELIAPLRAALHQTARIVRPAAFDPAVDRRVITVAMTTSTAFVIGGAIARLVARHAPNAVLRLRTADMTASMASSAVFTEEGTDVVLLPEGFPSAFPRERLYEDRWVVVTGAAAPAGATAGELLTTLPHVVFDGSARLLRPYDVLDEQGVRYTVRDRVDDNLLVPPLVAGSGGVGLHRHRVATALKDLLGLRLEEFPFPIPGLGIDMVWNPWLADDLFRTWLRGVLLEAAAAR